MLVVSNDWIGRIFVIHTENFDTSRMLMWQSNINFSANDRVFHDITWNIP